MADTPTKKIIKIGNSYGVTLERSLLEKSNMKLGDPLTLRVEQGEIVISPVKKEKAKKQVARERRTTLRSKISPELQQWTEEFLKENAQALEELAHL